MSVSDEPKKRGAASGTKKGRILALLRGGVSLNRFEAETHGDHTFNSTIAKLRADGQHILDKWETFPNHWGSITRVKRYRYVHAGRTPSAGQGPVRES